MQYFSTIQQFQLLTEHRCIRSVLLNSIELRKAQIMEQQNQMYIHRGMENYLAASSKWVAMCFLLLDGETQMALMPHTAGTASSSQKIAPIRFSSNTLSLATGGALLTASLWKIALPNWRVAGPFLAAFVTPLTGCPFSARGMTLNASFMGSATRHPAILCEAMKR